MRTLIWLLLVIANFLVVAGAAAKDRKMVSGPSYALGFAADLFIENAAGRFSQKYRIVEDEKNKMRIQRLLQNIFRYSGQQFIHARYNVIIVQGAQGEPNAFTTGKNIYVTQSLCNLMDDRELTAVLAHEMAHAERAHLLRRIVFSVGAPVLALYNYFAKNFTENGSHNPREILAEAHLGTEIEADCIAAKWLMQMRHEGQEHHAEDLNRATAKLFGGVGFLEFLDPSDPPVVRFFAIQNKFYDNDQCGL